MLLEWMQVRDFRCFTEAGLVLHPETTLLVGKNGQGKTSLLEAACVLMRLQSPRTSTRSDLIRFGAQTCVTEGAVGGRKLRVAQSPTARRVAVNDSVCPRAGDYLIQSARVVWMDHSDMNLARGGAEHRRRYLDFAAAQLFPEYLNALKSYERALRSRNFLLKRDAAISWRQVDAYGRILAEHGAAIRRCRDELVQRVQEPVTAAHLGLSAGAEPGAVAYVPGYPGEDLEAALMAVRDSEARLRTTQVGVHRDDLALTIHGRPAGAFASEGQQRTLCLALKLAQARVLEEAQGEPPLLLIDDIFGELDKTRRQALLAYLPVHGQKVITTTFTDWASETGIGGLVYEVEDGRLKEGGI